MAESRDELRKKRAAELEKKREKLAQLRAQKQERAEQKQHKSTVHGNAAEVAASNVPISTSSQRPWTVVQHESFNFSGCETPHKGAIVVRKPGG